MSFHLGGCPAENVVLGKTVQRCSLLQSERIKVISIRYDHAYSLVIIGKWRLQVYSTAESFFVRERVMLYRTLETTNVFAISYV